MACVVRVFLHAQPRGRQPRADKDRECPSDGRRRRRRSRLGIPPHLVVAPLFCGAPATKPAFPKACRLCSLRLSLSAPSPALAPVTRPHDLAVPDRTGRSLLRREQRSERKLATACNMCSTRCVIAFLSICSQALGQVELPDLPYAQDALEPYISEEVSWPACFAPPRR